MNKQDDVLMIWPSLFTSVPVVVRKDRIQSITAGVNEHKKAD
jgi:hypothetical protein